MLVRRSSASDGARKKKTIFLMRPRQGGGHTKLSEEQRSNIDYIRIYIYLFPTGITTVTQLFIYLFSPLFQECSSVPCFSRVPPVDHPTKVLGESSRLNISTWRVLEFTTNTISSLCPHIILRNKAWAVQIPPMATSET